jgi:hypothetical protein
MIRFSSAESSHMTLYPRVAQVIQQSIHQSNLLFRAKTSVYSTGSYLLYGTSATWFMTAHAFIQFFALLLFLAVVFITTF